MSLIRRMRGVVGIMAVWGLAFGVLGLVALIPLSLKFGPLEPHGPRLLVDMFVRCGLIGSAIGLGFATAILLRERRRSFVALSPRRFIDWGFVAGASVWLGLEAVDALMRYGQIPTLLHYVRFVDLLVGISIAVFVGLASAALAAATLRAAHRAPVSLDESLESLLRSFEHH